MAKEKTFYEEMLSRRAETQETIRQIQNEIKQVEERIADIDSQKAETVQRKDMKAFTDLCAEQDHLREYVESSKKFADSLSYKYPSEKIHIEWKNEKANLMNRMELERQTVLKLCKELYQIYNRMEAARTSVNDRMPAYQDCKAIDGSAYGDLSAVTVNDNSCERHLHKFLMGMDIIDYTGKLK